MVMNLRDWLERKTGLRERLPSGQHLVTSFPVLHAGPVPPFDPRTWRFKVFGLVDAEQSFTYKEFTAGTRFPITAVPADFHCVTTWSKFDNVWEGVRFLDLLPHLQVQPAAQYVMAHCAYGYTTNIPFADLQRDNVLFAWRHNGADLTPEHGYPLRLVVPHLYAWKSAKWLRGIEFMAKDAPGYWEQRGYHMSGDPWREQRYAWG
jgi:DMSO/TMAO reductase YedYZ molybdopterin-dependent catalytic subunit